MGNEQNELVIIIASYDEMEKLKPILQTVQAEMYKVLLARTQDDLAWDIEQYKPSPPRPDGRHDIFLLQFNFGFPSSPLITPSIEAVFERYHGRLGNPVVYGLANNMELRKEAKKRGFYFVSASNINNYIPDMIRGRPIQDLS